MTAELDDAEPPVIRMEHISKRYGTLSANRDVSLSVAEGEIHALVGENGAGKSTLMHILCGLTKPTSGRVLVRGHDVTGWDTNAAIRGGVGMVHQHFMLVPTLTVAENVVLGREPRRGLRFDHERAHEDVQALTASSGLTVAPNRLVSALSVGEAQRVEILKVLYRGARILVLDEPTAVLSPPEVNELWTTLRALRAKGDTILIITHKLDEVVEISDSVTVMRAGESVARMATTSTTPGAIARAMVGRDVALTSEPTTADRRPNTGATPPRAASGPVLQVRELTVPTDRGTPAVQQLSFELQPGEILGIAGVEGNGQTELIEVLAGLRRATSGSVQLLGESLLELSVQQRTDAGLAHIPEDRQRRGLVLEFSIADNLMLGKQHQFASRIGLDRAKRSNHAALQVERFDIRPPHPTLPVRALSGGNQQKVVIARELSRPFSVLLAAQPTRGVDVGAIAFIHAQLRAARAAGKAIILVSADLPEILALADRVAVMYAGRFTGEFPVSACSPAMLGPFMTGAQTTAPLTASFSAHAPSADAPSADAPSADAPSADAL